MIETIPVLSNAQGGQRISILKTGNFHKDENLKELCLSVDSGLYIWTSINSIEFVENISDDQKPYVISETSGAQINGFYIQKKTHGSNLVNMVKMRRMGLDQLIL